MINMSNLAENESSLERFRQGEIIFMDGDPTNDKMYILLEGTVEAYKNHGEPGQICIGTLQPWSFFGEMSLFLNKGRTATIVAAKDATVFVVNRAGINDFLISQPEIMFSIIQTLCMRLDSANVNVADISTEKSAIQASANTDPLTGVFNRRYFMQNAKRSVEMGLKWGRHVFIAMFDLDYFKKINDTYGHQAGDRVLVVFADMVSSSIRDNDIFARYGGEEFILLVSCATQDDAWNLVERIRVAISRQPIEFQGAEISVTTSVGVAELDAETDVESAIACADQALYKAKADGRNRTIFYE